MLLEREFHRFRAHQVVKIHRKVCPVDLTVAEHLRLQHALEARVLDGAGFDRVHDQLQHRLLLLRRDLVVVQVAQVGFVVPMVELVAVHPKAVRYLVPIDLHLLYVIMQ